MLIDSKLKKAIILIFLVLLADQVFKIWIKTTMRMGESITVFPDWFFIHFTENEGMAFGMKLGGEYGKLLLSLFRIAAVIVMGWWLTRISKAGGSMSLISCIALIMAGALGNILDSAFYGLIFSESTYMQVASIFPPDGGYATFLHGKVVDMLYFPIFETRLPEWIPIWGGEDFLFFRPVFNIADSSITTGVILLIIFQKKFFGKKEAMNETKD